MKLQDYIHYYIGCKVQHEFITKTKNVELRYGILMGLHTSEIINRCYLQFDSYSDSVRFDSIKPILRLVEDMTDEDIKSFIGFDRLIRMYSEVSYKRHNKMCITVYYTINTDGEADGTQVHDIHFSQLDSLQFHHLLKEGFDMFSLIKNGLAIDSKTLK